MAAQNAPNRDQILLRELGRWVWAILNEYHRHRTETEGMKVESLLKSNHTLVKEDWISMQG